MTDHSDPVGRGMVDHRFGDSGVPALNDDQIVRLRSLRESTRLLARHVLMAAPPSWERDQALTHLDDALSWASRAISRNE